VNINIHDVYEATYIAVISHRPQSASSSTAGLCRLSRISLEVRHCVTSGVTSRCCCCWTSSDKVVCVRWLDVIWRASSASRHRVKHGGLRRQTSDRTCHTSW